jgi:murein DD-endopeptidase MepM/ murein hydrolase activator NlpD
VKARNTYTIPIPKEMLQRIDRMSSPAHVGKLRNAIDFIAPVGTPVLAAAEGVITYIKDDSNVGGPDPAYWSYSNFITIKHSNGEFSRYDHLDFKSSNVRLYDKVHSGETIARVGLTGYTYLPHLHFQVFIFTGYNIWTDFDTIEVNDFEKII